MRWRKKDEEIVVLRNEVDRLKSQINKDSDNSSKPPSSDTKKNIPNNREKRNNKTRRQKGHKAYYLAKKDVEEKIRNKIYEHEIIDVRVKTTKYISKYIIDTKVTVVAKE